MLQSARSSKYDTPSGRHKGELVANRERSSADTVSRSVYRCIAATLFRPRNYLYLSALQMKNSIVPAALSRDLAPALPGATDISPLDMSSQGPGEEESGGGSGAKLRRYWAAVKRFRWLIIVLGALGTTAGVTATRFIAPVYEARGALWIADVGVGNGGGGAYRPPELLPNGSWIQLIRSFNVVDEVVAKQRLWVKGKTWKDSTALLGIMPTSRTIGGDYTLWSDSVKGIYSLSETKRGIFERGRLGDSVGRQVGLAWVPTVASLQGNQQVRFWVAQPRSVALGLIQRLDVAMQENSNFLTLTLTGADKWQTADLLNVWMQQFLKTAADLRSRSLNTQASILDAQRVSAQEGLRTAEGALQSFRSNAITKPKEVAVSPSAQALGITPPSDALSAEFFKNQTEYQAVKRSRESLEAIIPAARQGDFSPDVLAAIPAIQGAPALNSALKDLSDKEGQLRALRQSYTDSFPAVKNAVQAVQTLRTQTIPDLLTTQLNLLRTRESRIAADVKADSAALEGIPARTTQEQRLRRDQATAEALYSNVENRYETARLGAESTVPDVTILDPALPAASAQRDMKAVLVGGGFIGAIGFGIVIALLFDMLDHRFRYSEQIPDELGLDVMGAVPTVPKPGDADKDPDAVLQSVEAFRGLRMNLHHMFDAPPVMLTVSSPGVGDGKSMISSNLALSFAEAGFRTLLIDGDIRRGKLHSIFGIDRRPGLVDYLSGEFEASQVMREVPVHGALTLIASGTRRHRGPELLTSARLPALLNQVRTMFDVIIIDSAPLAAGVDAYALSVATRNLLLVMRTGHTDRRVAKAKLKLMHRLPVRLLGAVVNAVSSADIYTEYSYLYGYGADSEAEETNLKDDEVMVLGSGKAGTNS
jgi:capsular exopolysaccharide synthesis family protein